MKGRGIRQPSLQRGCIVTLFLVSAAATVLDCAGPARSVHHTKHLLFEADSLFACGDYGRAKEKYAMIRSKKPNSEEAKSAQFHLAYTDVFYKNDNADWERSLKEFKTYIALYPRDRRAHEALSWIRLLTVIKSFNSEFKSASRQVERLLLYKDESRTTRQASIDSIASVLHNCHAVRDSLVKKNHELENVIIDLEKKYQRAGQ